MKCGLDLTRTIIIGNSGAGKSWLAERLAAHVGAPWVDLDLIHWEPGGYDVARKREDAIALVKRAAPADGGWVVEGIYGWLIREVEAIATTLIWISVDESECIANIKRRGVRRGGNRDTFTGLLRWAETYKARDGSSSYAAHESIFSHFSGGKARLHDEEEVTAFARSVGTSLC